MDYLIKYRNDRKKEGATKAELNGLDGRINASFSNGVHPMDLELLMYRREIAAGGDKEFLARLDKHIFHQLGSKPANIVEVAVSSLAKVASGVYIAVDLANETIGDLSTKANTALGREKQGKLIFMGNSYDDPKKPLSETPLCSGAMVVIIDEHRREHIEIAQTYARLCDADLRSAKKVFDGVSAEKLHELFLLVSMLNLEPVARRADVLRCVVEPKDIVKAVWDNVSTVRNHEVACALAKPLIALAPPLEAKTVAKICSMLSEKPTAATAATAAPISDDDLYT